MNPISTKRFHRHLKRHPKKGHSCCTSDISDRLGFKIASRTSRFSSNGSGRWRPCSAATPSACANLCKPVLVCGACGCAGLREVPPCREGPVRNSGWQKFNSDPASKFTTHSFTPFECVLWPCIQQHCTYQRSQLIWNESFGRGKMKCRVRSSPVRAL